MFGGFTAEEEEEGGKEHLRGWMEPDSYMPVFKNCIYLLNTGRHLADL